MIGQRFACAGHRKQPQAGGVEQEDGMPHAADSSKPEERRETRDGRDRQVPPILDRRGRNGADQDIAGDPSKRRRGKGKDEDAEEVEFVAGARNRAADGKGKGPEEIEDREQEVDDYVLSNGHDDPWRRRRPGWRVQCLVRWFASCRR
jgi:hypothetical protein